MKAPYVLTIRFKKGAQEIKFRRKPRRIDVENHDGCCSVFVNNLPYVRFCAEGWAPPSKGLRQRPFRLWRKPEA